MSVERDRRYCLITPARNEALHIHYTLVSVTTQTLQPTEWLIVDDGSSDATAQVVSDWVQRFEYIQLLRRPDRGHDSVGAGVVEAFNVGYRRLQSRDVPYVGKLDADVELESDYFQRLIEWFERSKKGGIASGQSYLRADSELLHERFQSFHPVGSARLYGRDCLQHIDGLEPVPGWDTLDLIRARMGGYQTQVLEGARVIHRRPMGSRGDLSVGVQRLGSISYRLGYTPVYFLMRLFAYVFRKPYLLRAWWLLMGYLRSAARRDSRITTEEERRWLRRFQLERLMGRSQ